MNIKKMSEIEEEYKEPLIKLKDDELIGIDYENESYPGYCQTCDYGAHTITTIDFLFKNTKRRTIDYKSDGSEPLFTESELILFFTTNLKEFEKITREEFLTFVKERKNII